jgi:hypothetical protein
MRGWLNRARLRRLVRPHRSSDLRLKLADIPVQALTPTQRQAALLTFASDHRPIDFSDYPLVLWRESFCGLCRFVQSLGFRFGDPANALSPDEFRRSDERLVAVVPQNCRDAGTDSRLSL